MTDLQPERYINYKSYVLALLSGILIGVVTNYIVFFIPQHPFGLLIGLCVLAIIAWFLFSRFVSPKIVVSQPLPENIKGRRTLTIRGDAKTLMKRFVYQANLQGAGHDILIELSNSGLNKYKTPVVFDRFLPLAKEKCAKRIRKTVDLLDLTEEEKQDLQKKIDARSEPFLLEAGFPFKYRSLSNWSQRGTGIFLLNEFGKPTIECVITPFSLSLLSRRFVSFHNSLQRNLIGILHNLLEDAEFKAVIDEIFTE